MTDSFDKQLLGQLSEEDEAFLARLEEDRGLYAQMSDTFQGPLRYWTAFAFVLSLVFFIAAVYAFWRLGTGKVLTEQLMWLGGFLAFMIAVGLIKVWFWMRINQVALLRELKKVELQVARLSDTVSRS